MPLVGIIAKKREFQAIKKELQDYNIELIHINKESIKNIGNIFFEEIVILEDINLLTDEYEFMDKLILKTRYLIINADIEINILKYIKIDCPVKVITFGFNSKATITISSVNDEKIIICLQRNLELADNKVIESQEREIKIRQDTNKKIHNKLVVFIIKELHNLKSITRKCQDMKEKHEKNRKN